uniref:splicing factor U2AF 35 kDa subunit-like isoform X1 n=1 Tax=Myxine glutinosa TaxID=7769 RepID=UPI00358F40CB
MAEYLASIFGTEKDKYAGFGVAGPTRCSGMGEPRGPSGGYGDSFFMLLNGADGRGKLLWSCGIRRHNGSEEDKVNCSFYFKIGACRHGDRCSRLHNKPTFSQTIALLNLYQNPQNCAQTANGVCMISDVEMQQHYDDFFEEVFTELEEKYGEIEEMNVCDNLGDHLVGNVYVKFRYEEDAEKAVNDLNNRWFNGHPIHAELSPVTDFREACCRQYEMGECTRGGFCNFMHLKPISRELRRELYGRGHQKKHHKLRSHEKHRSRSHRHGGRQRTRRRSKGRAGRF